MIIKFYQFLNESDYYPQVVYHGSFTEHDFSEKGNVYGFGTFFSTDIDFASYYGTNKYEITLKPYLNLFDTGYLEDCEKIFQHFEILYDDYYDKDTEPDEYYIKTPEQLYDNADSWSIIEKSHGVMDWLQGNYDGVIIFEDGVKNILIFPPVKDKIVNIEKIK
jgi:hypothetical protein